MNTQTWKVLPDQKALAESGNDPSGAIFHANRYIATDDAQWDGPDILESGWIICTMRDLPSIERYARAIALVPEMLHALRTIADMDYRGPRPMEQTIAADVLERLI